MTEQELLDALRAALPSAEHDQSALSMVEIAERLGMSRAAAHKRVVPLVRSGQLVCVRKRMTRIDGARSLVPAYRPA